ncbi:MAG: Ig-like domain-containing protein, partial [Candidatus Thermoplasmatota archaeon]|nr:Ig-like domain-containing protein [Candidatus Thermoplasmatota archaeon]
TFKTYGYNSDGDTNNPPQVVITYPHNRDTISGNITITGTAFDPDGYVQNVKVNTGGEWKTASGTISWIYDWDTTNLDDGDYGIKAIATDNKSWPSETALVYVTVDNSGGKNSPPNKPSDPDPANHSINVDINTNLSWTGGDPDANDTVTYDVYFGSMPPFQKIASNISNMSINPGNLVNGLTYFWSIVAWDNHNASTVGPGWYFTTINPNNRPPNKPSKPSGQTKGKIGQNYSYTTSTTDLDGDQLYYNWSWGDSTYSGWIGPYYSGENVNESHNWTKKGNYEIKVKAKDIFDTESDWSDPLAIRMPKIYTCNQIIQQLMNMLHRFPFIEKILNQYSN